MEISVELNEIQKSCDEHLRIHPSMRDGRGHEQGTKII
jgi:hypothetical protein